MPIPVNSTSYLPPSGSNTGVEPTPKPDFTDSTLLPIVVDSSSSTEWKPTPEQFKVDQLHLQRFDLKDTLRTAQNNYNAVLANPKSTKTAIKQAGDDLRNAKSSVDKFEKKNPKLKTASFELDALISAYRKAYTKAGSRISTELKNAVRDMIGGFKDGVYPSKNSIKDMLTQLSDAAPKPAPKPEPKPAVKGPDLNKVYKMVTGTYDTIQDAYGNQFQLAGFQRLGPDGKIIEAKGLGPLPQLNTIG